MTPSPFLLLETGTAPPPPFPPVPTREQVCGVINRSMNTCPYTMTKQYGLLPLFDPVIACLDLLEDRQASYASKHAMGDRHCIIEFFSSVESLYDEPDNPYQAIPTWNCEADPARFLALLEEIILAGFIPLVVYDGDNGDNAPYGSANALRQLPILAGILRSSKHRSLTQDVLCGRLWDGVFYGSSAENIKKFGTAFRAEMPEGYLCIEHQPGKIPSGDGEADWHPGGNMEGYDALLSEINFNNYYGPDDGLWQVAGRTIRPYHRPPEQQGDPNPPFYLVDSPRGPRYACCFEWEGTYFRVRGKSTIEDEAERRAYIVALGYTYTG